MTSTLIEKSLDPYALDVALRIYEEAVPDATGVTYEGVTAAIKAYLAAEHDPNCGKRYGEFTYICGRCSSPRVFDSLIPKTVRGEKPGTVIKGELKAEVIASGIPSSTLNDETEAVAKAISKWRNDRFHNEQNWDEIPNDVKAVYRAQASAAIAAMQGFQCEIRFNEQELKDVVTKAILKAEPLDFIVAGGTLNQFGEKYILRYRALEMCWAAVKAAVNYMRTTEPVSVSLEKCARALAGIYYDDHGDMHFTSREQYCERWLDFIEDAKAFLNAIGIKYVD